MKKYLLVFISTNDIFHHLLCVVSLRIFVASLIRPNAWQLLSRTNELSLHHWTSIRNLVVWLLMHRPIVLAKDPRLRLSLRSISFILIRFYFVHFVENIWFVLVSSCRFHTQIGYQRILLFSIRRNSLVLVTDWNAKNLLVLAQMTVRRVLFFSNSSRFLMTSLVSYTKATNQSTLWRIVC